MILLREMQGFWLGSAC